MTIGLLGLLAVAGAEAAFVQVRPLRAEIHTEPEQPFSFTIGLANEPGGSPVTVHLEISDTVQTPDGEALFPEAGSTEYSCAAWLSMETPEPLIGPGESFSLVVNGKVPAGSEGSYHAAILVTPMLPATEGAGLPRMVPGLTYAFPVDVLIGDTGYVGLRIDDLGLGQLPYQGFELTGQRPAGLVVAGLRNVGDRVAYLRGEYTIRTLEQGRVVARCNVGRDPGVRVLPDTTTQVSSAFLQDLPPGEYEIVLNGMFDVPARLVHARRRIRWDGKGPSEALTPLVAEVEAYRLEVEPARLPLPLGQASRTVRRLVVRNREAMALQCEVEVTGLDVAPDGTLVPHPAGGPVPQISPRTLKLAGKGAGSLQLRLSGSEELGAETEHYWLVVVRGRPEGEVSDPQEIGLGKALLIASDPVRATPARVVIQHVEVVAGLNDSELRLTLANEGGTLMPLAGQVQLKAGEQLYGPWPYGGADRPELLAGTSQTVVVRVPGDLPAQDYDGELMFQGKQGTVRLPFRMRRSAQAAPPAETRAP